MNQLDKEIEAVAAVLRANGGIVGFDPHAPDHVKKAFLEMILGCPDCRQAVLGKHDGRAIESVNEKRSSTECHAN